MAYDQAKLIQDVRLCLGGISEEKLPESVIIHFADQIDSDTEHTGDYPWIFWKSTLTTLNYLKAAATTSDAGSAKSIKEKVGNVSKDVSYVTSKEIIEAYDALYDDYAASPEKFGVVITTPQSPVIINGVNAQEVDDYRNNRDTTSVYNALGVTAFPKHAATTNRRR